MMNIEKQIEERMKRDTKLEGFTLKEKTDSFILLVCPEGHERMVYIKDFIKRGYCCINCSRRKSAIKAAKTRQEKRKLEGKKERKTFREEIAEKFNFTCVACGKTNLISQKEADELARKHPEKEKEFKDRVYHVDHITPKIKGGSDDLENLQLLCRRCNVVKSGGTMEDLMEYLNAINQLEVLTEKISRVVGVEKELLDKLTQGNSKIEVALVFSKIWDKLKELE